MDAESDRSRGEIMNLLDEYPLLVFPSLAKKIGLNESIVIQQIHYWIEQNKRSNRQTHFFGGRWWSYNSYPQWQENFPFWSYNTIKRTIGNLEKLGVLLSTQHSANKLDRTKWYSIDYEKFKDVCSKKSVPSAQNEPMYIDPSRAVPSAQNEPMINIQRIHTETISERREERVRATPAIGPTVLDGEILEPDSDRIPESSSSEEIKPGLISHPIENTNVPARWEPIGNNPVDTLCAIWNERKGALWAKVRVPPSKARLNALKRFISSCDSNETAIEYFKGALEYMRNDEYWAIKENLSIDNVLTNGKVHQNYERWLELQENPGIKRAAAELKERARPKSFEEMRLQKCDEVLAQAIAYRKQTHPEEFEDEDF